MADTYMTQRIENISETDFWSSFRKDPGLAEACLAGLAGKRAVAYGLLGRFHAERLKGEVGHFKAETAQAASTGAAGIRKGADRVLRRDIVGWHTHRHQFGPVIDFNADYGRSGQYGFHYLNWLSPVLQQYALTGEAAYRDDFVTIAKQYYDQRTTLTWRIPGLHPVYYELGAYSKTRVFLPAYALLAQDPAFDTDAHEAMLKLLLGFARSLHRLSRDGYRAGNWQIVGAATLYWIGAAFPEFKEASAWRKRGETRIEEHARRDFFSDGGHGERCWGYGIMSLRGMLKYHETARRYGRLTPARKQYWTRFFHRGYRWYAAATTPSRHTLNFGDGSIGDASGIFAEAAREFPALARTPGLLGVDRTRSNILRPSGYAFMRAGDQPDAAFMCVNFGGSGGGHTHQDLLDFSLWSHGQPLLDEVGRFGSYDNPLDPMFRSAPSHNQIVIENGAMNRHGQEGHDVVWHASDNIDMFSAWHGAFAQARIHRQIVFVRPDYWVVFDAVTAPDYIFQVTSWLHGGAPFQAAGPGRWRLRGRPSCLVALAMPEDLRRSNVGVDYDLNDYGELAQNPEARRLAGERHRLGLMKWRDVGDQRPITFAMVLAPFRARMPVVEVQARTLADDSTGQATAVRVHWQGRNDVFVFNPAAQTVKTDRRVIRAPLAARINRCWHMPAVGGAWDAR